MSINHVAIGGNLTRDPEIMYLPSGTAIANFSIANNRKYKVNGEKHEEVSFIDCTAFGKTAETISEYLSKGSGVIVEGRLKTDSWEDKNTGAKRSKLKVIVNLFHFVGGKKNEAPKNEEKRGEPAPPDLALDEDIPF